ncbi:putative disease resistance protein [Camellia lanceoleosa]|uniref:Disease resistance protein n=1 Tax=Camellia lanceoleosa TaxID=1840588 RepID=A0ACC0FQS2_9ERIC|nr:putative disease resistance protein [Camellia lanceoleosa]
MAEGIGFSFLGKALGGIGEYLVAPIGRQFGFLFCFNTNLQNLETQLDSLKVTREGVQLGVDETRNNVRTVGPHLEVWMTKANDNTAEAETIIKDKAQVQKGCFNGWCPNLKLRYSLGRKAVKKTRELALLHGEGSKYIQSSYNPPPQSIEPIPTTTEFQGFDSRILVMNEIIEALEDDGIHLIGICGMGGMGKTTMAKEVVKRTKNLFNEFPMAVVSQEPDLTKVQGCIADMLGLKLDERESPIARAGLLRKSLLLDNKKILVILDDIWEEFDLEELGFPLEGGSNKSCKMLFTSRNRNLWKRTQNKRHIQLQVLVGEEPWHLFREKVGDCADDLDLLPLAKQIVNECGGLPLALVTIGRALTNEHNQHHWNNALQQLRTPCSESLSSEVPAKVYQALYFSYNFLKEDRAKKLFLLCCLYPEDYNISIEYLVRYGIGLRWFEGIDKVDEKFDNISVIGKLLNLEILCFYDSNIEELPEEIGGLVNLKLLDLTDCYELKRIAPGVISSLVQLQELYLGDPCEIIWEREGKEGRENASLRELESLSNLNTLEINIEDVKCLPIIPLFSKLTKYSICIGCDVIGPFDGEHITSVGNFLKLCGRRTIRLECINSLLRSSAVLQLRGKGSNDAVQELFREGVEGLQHLKDLVIDRCATPECFVNTMEWVPRNAIPPIFPILENLALNDLPNLRKMCHCQLPTGSFGKLKHLGIYGCDRMEEVIWKEKGEYDATNKMEFPALESMTLSNLPMLIGFCRGIDEIEFPQLKELSLRKLPQLKWLFLNSSNPFSESMEDHNATFLSLFPHKVAFPSLEKLELHGFQNMNEIWWNQLQTGSFNKLFSLDVSDCGSLRNMFSPFMARHLVHLKRLVIIRCSMMEEVVAKEEEEGGRINRTPLPKLEYLELKDLAELKSFCHITHDWELPMVEHVTILKCPKLKTFSPGVICTPKLQRVRVKELRDKWYQLREGDCLWISDLNQTIPHQIDEEGTNVDSTRIMSAGSSPEGTRPRSGPRMVHGVMMLA